jgi:hypothetical protein
MTSWPDDPLGRCKTKLKFSGKGFNKKTINLQEKSNYAQTMQQLYKDRNTGQGHFKAWHSSLQSVPGAVHLGWTPCKCIISLMTPKHIKSITYLHRIKEAHVKWLSIAESSIVTIPAWNCASGLNPLSAWWPRFTFKVSHMMTAKKEALT